MDNESLTQPQARLLACIRGHAERGDPVPSYRDFCAEFGWASTGTARDHLQALARKGYITLGGGRARQVRLAESPAAVTLVPVLGRVVAGRPEEATALQEGNVPVPADWLGRGRFFALRVNGDSMRDAAILDGDTVVVREQRTATTGDIIVATFHGDTTVKQVRIDTTGVQLVPANPHYEPIRVDDEDFCVHGTVVAVLRRIATTQQRTRSRSAEPGERA
ncbi:MAG: transcriptional repressor LexA [Candidatus Geothermincolia bacterium]